MSTPNPRPRRRGTNIDTTPQVPVYETQAREAFRANKAKNAAAKIERDSRSNCHRSMAAEEISRFEFTEDGDTVEALISSGEKTTVNVEQLHNLVLDGTITMPQFLKSVSATQTSVKKELGSDVLARCSKTDITDASLSIKVKKG